MPEEASTTPEKNEKGYHQYIVQLKEMLPILSVILVFLGYWNLDSYYYHFNLEIYNYLTISEIVLSFLPVIKVLLVRVIITGLLIVIMFYTLDRFNNWIRIIIPLLIAIGIGFSLYFISISHQILSGVQDILLIILSIAYYRANRNKFYMNLYTFSMIVILIGTFYQIWEVNFEKYKSIRENEYSITITIDNIITNTDSNLVYIGQTQNYLFLRKLKEETNVIYKISDIDKLEIEGKKIK